MGTGEVIAVAVVADNPPAVIELEPEGIGLAVLVNGPPARVVLVAGLGACGEFGPGEVAA